MTTTDPNALPEDVYEQAFNAYVVSPGGSLRAACAIIWRAAIARRAEPVEPLSLTTREAARRRVPLDGADAQALEGSLSQVERELAAATARAEAAEREQGEAYAAAVDGTARGDRAERRCSDMEREFDAALARTEPVTQQERDAHSATLAKLCDERNAANARAESWRAGHAEKHNEAAALRAELADAVKRAEEMTEAHGAAARERDGWMESARHFSQGSEYYLNLLDSVGKTLGPRAFTADDGSLSDGVLRAKVPELVEELKRERDRFALEFAASEKRLSEAEATNDRLRSTERTWRALMTGMAEHLEADSRSRENLAKDCRIALAYTHSGAGAPVTPATLVSLASDGRLVVEMWRGERKVTLYARPASALATNARDTREMTTADALAWLDAPAPVTPEPLCDCRDDGCPDCDNQRAAEASHGEPVTPEPAQLPPSARIIIHGADADTRVVLNASTQAPEPAQPQPSKTERRMRKAIEGLLSAMDMQVKREKSELHIPADSARTIWNDAVNAARRALRPDLPGTVLMGEPAQPQGEGRRPGKLVGLASAIRDTFDCVGTPDGDEPQPGDDDFDEHAYDQATSGPGGEPSSGCLHCMAVDALAEPAPPAPVQPEGRPPVGSVWERGGNTRVVGEHFDDEHGAPRLWRWRSGADGFKYGITGTPVAELQRVGWRRVDTAEQPAPASDLVHRGPAPSTDLAPLAANIATAAADVARAIEAGATFAAAEAVRKGMAAAPIAADRAGDGLTTAQLRDLADLWDGAWPRGFSEHLRANADLRARRAEGKGEP